MKDTFANNVGVRAVLLLLADLVAPVYVIWADLNGQFESVGGFGLLLLIPIGVVIHTVTMLVLRRISCGYLIQTKSWGTVSANTVVIVMILLWSLFLTVLPGYAVKSFAPSYDTYVKNTAINDLKKLEPLYMEPSYLPPQVKFISKRTEEESWSKGGYVRILTRYSCSGLNKPTYGNVSVSLAPFTMKYNLQNPETVTISGKEAVFVGSQELALYDGNITREVYRSGECGVTKDDLVKIMESLQPAQFVSGTQQNYGPAYHTLDVK
jgi:hypothetical protein